MADMNNYQGGGATRLSGFVDGVYGAYKQSRDKEQALALQKQKEQEKSDSEFQKSLADTMAKVSTKGLQQKDIPGFQNLWKNMEEEAIKAMSSTDKTERLMASARFKEAGTKATLYVQQSEALGKKKNDMMKMLQTNYEKFDADSALKALNEHFDKPVDQVDMDFDLLNYRKKWDSKQIDTDLKEIQKTALDSVGTSAVDKVAAVQNGYDTVNTFRYTKQIPEQMATNLFKNRYDTNPNFKAYVDTNFEGPLDNKLKQLYSGLGSAWNTQFTEDRRTQGRAPVRSSSSSSSDSDLSGDVVEGGDVAYAGDKTLRAAKQAAFKGNSMKARINKDVRAYDLNTGQPIDITSNMSDGIITELVNIPTAELGKAGRRPILKGSEKNYPTIKNEDFAVVKYKKPIYVSSEDKDQVISNKSQEFMQKEIANKRVVIGGYEEHTGLFPMNSVLPSENSMTKGERNTVNTYKSSKGTPTKPAEAKKQSDAVKKVLKGLQ